MAVKDAIKQRRQDRIRRLMEQTWDNSAHPGAQQQSNQLDNWQQPRDRPADLPILDESDPEEAWKRHSNPWTGAGWDGMNKHNGGTPPDKRPYNGSGGGSGWSRLGRSLGTKLVLSAFLFAGIWGMFSLSAPWAQIGQSYVKHALSEDMDFAEAASWYRATFADAPSFIPIFNQQGEKAAASAEGKVELPVYPPVQGGTVVTSFAELLNGVDIAAAPEAKVTAVETGRVTLITGDVKTGFTVVIQHANQRVSIYGKLGSSTVAVNDWVEAGRQIGTLQPGVEGDTGLLYFAVKDKGKYIDPADVVQLD